MNEYPADFTISVIPVLAVVALLLAAVAWLENRLHDLITRTVTGVAGRPLTVRYANPEMQEAHP